MQTIRAVIVSTLLVLLGGCGPAVGSDAWCKAMTEKDKGDWTANEATEFAGNCIFKSYEE